MASLAEAGSGEVVQALTQIRGLKREILRREVLENERIDVLATRTLGYELRPFHRSLLDFQSTVPFTPKTNPLSARLVFTPEARSAPRRSRRRCPALRSFRTHRGNPDPRRPRLAGSRGCAPPSQDQW